MTYWSCLDIKAEEAWRQFITLWLVITSKRPRLDNRWPQFCGQYHRLNSGLLVRLQDGASGPIILSAVSNPRPPLYLPRCDFLETQLLQLLDTLVCACRFAHLTHVTASSTPSRIINEYMYIFFIISSLVQI